MSGVILVLTLIILIAELYAWRTGMWTAHGGGFHGSLGPLALAFATAAGFLGLLDVTGLFAPTPFPAPPSIDFASLLVAIAPYAAIYMAFRWAPFAHHRFLTVALFDRVLEGKPVLRAYRQRRSGQALAEMLEGRGRRGYR